MPDKADKFNFHYIKKAARYPSRILISVLFAAAAYISHIVTVLSDTAAPYKNKNLRYNKTHKFEGFIYDQSSGNAALIKMGYHRGSYNGCGWIAVYNAALINGLSFQPAAIINYLENHGGILINGLLGSNPVTLRTFFVNAGLNARIYFLPDCLDTLIKNASSGVLMYAHKKGMHFVAIQYDAGLFNVYNEHPGCNGYISVNSVDRWLKEASREYFTVSLIVIV